MGIASWRFGRKGESEPERSPAEVLEHFDFQNPVFQDPESLSGKLDSDPDTARKAKLNELFHERSGVDLVLQFLDGAEATEPRETLAWEYVLQRRNQGTSKRKLRSEMKEVLDALDAELAERVDKYKNP
jgi:hypothetical protein